MSEQAGVELAARVANDVMNWASCLCDIGVVWLRKEDGVFTKYGVGEWRPDLNVAQAMEVADKLHADGFYWVFYSPTQLGAEATLFRMSFFKMETPPEAHAAATATTKGVAICLAALKAAEAPR